MGVASKFIQQDKGYWVNMLGKNFWNIFFFLIFTRK